MENGGTDEGTGGSEAQHGRGTLPTSYRMRCMTDAMAFGSVKAAKCSFYGVLLANTTHSRGSGFMCWSVSTAKSHQQMTVRDVSVPVE